MASSNAVFFSDNGDHSNSPRGSICLDVSLFADENLNYKYTTVPSEIQDPHGQLIHNPSNCSLNRKGGRVWLQQSLRAHVSGLWHRYIWHRAWGISWQQQPRGEEGKGTDTEKSKAFRQLLMKFQIWVFSGLIFHIDREWETRIELHLEARNPSLSET